LRTDIHPNRKRGKAIFDFIIAEGWAVRKLVMDEGKWAISDSEDVIYVGKIGAGGYGEIHEVKVNIALCANELTDIRSKTSSGEKEPRRLLGL
jgi:hypothetical protein